MSKNFQQAIKIGQQGIDLFYNKNYIKSKQKCIEACRILQKIKDSNGQTNESIKGYMMQFLTIAQSASQRLGKDNNTKISKQNNLFNSQIEADMIVKADTSFQDIVGLDEIKQIIKQSIIYPNMRPDLYKGIRSPPRGILFYGPPGNGKTLMAKAVATQCKSTFFNVTAASLMSKWVGDSQRMLKAIFDQAYKRQPSIIFFDEIDAILSSRSENQNDASRRLKTQFLVQLDGVSTSDKDRVMLIAATNLPNDLDKAALRRFTKKILIDLPDPKARKHMITKQIKDIKYSLRQSQIDEISSKLQLYSGADIKNLIREAVMMPIRELSYQTVLKIDKNSIRAVNKQDFIKAIQISPPTLNQEQYLLYKKFGDSDSKPQLNQTQVVDPIPIVKKTVSSNENKHIQQKKTPIQTIKKAPISTNTKNTNEPIRHKVRIIRYDRDPITGRLVRKSFSPDKPH